MSLLEEVTTSSEAVVRPQPLAVFLEDSPQIPLKAIKDKDLSSEEQPRPTRHPQLEEVSSARVALAANNNRAQAYSVPTSLSNKQVSNFLVKIMN
jgi:heat shock protein HspQ